MCLINVEAKPLFDVVEANCVDTLQQNVCKIDISNDLNTISFAHNSLINLHNTVIQHNEIILNLVKLRGISLDYIFKYTHLESSLFTRHPKTN